MSFSDPLLDKKNLKKGIEEGGGGGERENLPRVKALIITSDPAEERSQSSTLFRACFTAVTLSQLSDPLDPHSFPTESPVDTSTV